MKELKESFIDFMMFLLLFAYRMTISATAGFIIIFFMVYLGIPVMIKPEIILLMTAFVIFFVSDCIRDYNELKNTDKITINVRAEKIKPKDVILLTETTGEE